MPSSQRARVVIRETRHSYAVWRTVFALLGLGAVAVIVSVQPYLTAQDLSAPLVSLGLAFGVVLLGVAALGSWRRSEDVEAVEVNRGRLQLVMSFCRQPLFDAPLEIAQIHRFMLPKNAGMKLFLRDGERAVEVGADMAAEDRESLANRLDALVANVRGSVPTAPRP